MQLDHYDVVIVGGGPAGLQAALVLARTRKKIIVFDSPEPPRNQASHGVHNFVGLDGLLPAQIREQAWQQIAVYDSARLCIERVTDIQQDESESFVLYGEKGALITVSHVILAVGFRDVHPTIPGFAECWGSTIISCPFCDGFENRDRMWGLVADSARALEHFPLLYRHWTPNAKLIVSPDLASHVDSSDSPRLPIYVGEIVEVHHVGGGVSGVTLDSGERIDVETLWWVPQETPTEITRRVIENFQLALDAKGYIQTDAGHQTSVRRLWAVGDVKGSAGALGAAWAGHFAALNIIREWFA